MVRGGIGAGSLPLLALAAALIAGPARGGEPLVLDPAALDSVTAGAATKAKAGSVGLPIRAVTSISLADLALKLADRSPAIVPEPGGNGSTGKGKRSLTKSGSKTFKADRVTKPHRESLVVSGSVGG